MTYLSMFSLIIRLLFTLRVRLAARKRRIARHKEYKRRWERYKRGFGYHPTLKNYHESD